MKNLTKDEFAKWAAEQILGIKCYSYDMFYDIANIVVMVKGSAGKSQTPIREERHLMVRPTGSDMVEPTHPAYNVYLDRNTRVYRLVFCLNEQYFDEPFCQMEDITKELRP